MLLSGLIWLILPTINLHQVTYGFNYEINKSPSNSPNNNPNNTHIALILYAIRSNLLMIDTLAPPRLRSYGAI